MLLPAPSRRLVGVDAARGVALLGMMAVHVLPGQDADGSASLSDQVAGGRSAALFAVLAGVALALASGRPRGRRRARVSAALVVRAVLVGALGLALGSLDSGVVVILAYYAVLFVLVLPWLGAGVRVLLAGAAAVALVLPVVSFAVRDGLPAREPGSPTYADLADPGQLLSELLVTGTYPALPWTSYLLLGLAVGRLSLGRRRTAALVAGAGAALALAATGTSALLLGPLGGYARLDPLVAVPSGRTLAEVVAGVRPGNVPTTSPWWLATDAAHSTTPFDLVATAGTALLVLGLALLVTGRAPWLLLPLTAVGSMPLTLYTAHVCFLGLVDVSPDPAGYYLGQALVGVVLALVWRQLVGRGPLEALVARVAGLVHGRRPAVPVG